MTARDINGERQDERADDDHQERGVGHCVFLGQITVGESRSLTLFGCTGTWVICQPDCPVDFTTSRAVVSAPHTAKNSGRP